MPRKPVDPLRAKVLAYLKARDKGKAEYGKADALLQELVAELPLGQVVQLPGGRTAEVVDQFAEKFTVWKPAGITRFAIKVKE